MRSHVAYSSVAISNMNRQQLQATLRLLNMFTFGARCVRFSHVPSLHPVHAADSDDATDVQYWRIFDPSSPPGTPYPSCMYRTALAGKVVGRLWADAGAVKCVGDAIAAT